ncbi:MAG: DUF255 domain-containing protein [Bacteroidetes bacterium]|nr:DUF255 domain-containing protein [Bacteroidota bacterium]
MGKFVYISLAVALVGLAFIAKPYNKIAQSNQSTIVNQSQETKGVQFQNITFNQALKKAKEEKKLIFMNVYAVWCGPCKMLKNTTFQSEKVANILNENFINLDIDAEKGEGIELSQRYNVEAHPLMLLIDENGKVVKSILGYRKDAQLINEIKDFVKK